MTYREKMMMEHPERLNNKYMGSVDGCPEDRLELKASECEHDCIECWSREIPGTPRIEYDLSLIRKDLFAEANIIMKENNGGDMTYKERYLKEHPADCECCWNREIPESDEIIINPTETIAETKAAVDSLREKVGSVPVIPPVQISKILDSGERRQFKTGAVRDIQEGKGRMDLLPWAAIMEVSKHCENGANKYGEHNIDKGIPTHSLCDSAARHLAKYIDGWTDEPHLLAAAWNLLWAIQMELKHPELCDVPWEKTEHEI